MKNILHASTKRTNTQYNVCLWLCESADTTASCCDVLGLSPVQRTRTRVEPKAVIRCFSSSVSCFAKKKKIIVGPIWYLCHVKSSVQPVRSFAFLLYQILACLCVGTVCIWILGGTGHLEESPFTQLWLCWLLSGKSPDLGGVFKLVSVAIFPCWLISHDTFQERSIPNFGTIKSELDSGFTTMKRYLQATWRAFDSPVQLHVFYSFLMSAAWLWRDSVHRITQLQHKRKKWWIKMEHIQNCVCADLLCTHNVTTS